MRLGRTLVGGLAMALCAATAYADEAPADDKQAEPKGEEALDRDLDKNAVKRVAQRSSGNDSQGTTGQPGNAQQPPPDEAEEEAPVPKRMPPRVPWRGTALAWSHSVTSSALGIGQDYQSPDFQTYTQTFALGLNYFVVDQDRFSVAVATSPSFTVELTDSNTTTTRREPQFNDLPVSGVLRSTLYAHDSLPIATGGVLNTTLILPTHPASYGGGTYLTTSPRVTLWQSIPLLPEDVSSVLNAFYLGASFRWDHRFGEATTPVNGRIQDADRLPIARQNLIGETYFPDQLSFSRFAENTIREGFFIFTSDMIGPTQLNFFASMSFTQSFLPKWSDQTVGNVLTGPVTVPPSDDDPNRRHSYGFAIGVDFFPIPEAGLSVSYANNSYTLGLDGRRQSPFYSPSDAQFSAGLVVSLDAIYEAAAGERRGTPFVLVADNKKQKDEDKKRGPAPKGGMPTAF